MFTYADADCDGCNIWAEFQTMINPPQPADQFMNNPQHTGQFKINPSKPPGQLKINPTKHTVQWASRPTKKDLVEKTTFFPQVPVHPQTLSVSSIMNHSETNIPREVKPFLKNSKVVPLTIRDTHVPLTIRESHVSASWNQIGLPTPAFRH